jgi:hypothetical protein
VGTLASALGPIAADLSRAPRVYVDANVPTGLVTFMRCDLHWDVFFVLEEAPIRRAPDAQHFERALDYRRTLITLDTDFLNPDKFPPASGPGVLVLSAPDERGLRRLIAHADRTLMRPEGSMDLPLRGRTVHLTPDVAA